MWRILIVDGDSKYRRLLRELFERAGHVVTEAGEGGPVVGLAQAARPQVILLDVDLPDMRGAAVCRRLKANPKTSSIPVAIVTSHGDEDTRVEGFEAGADDYVLKPFSFRELLSRIRGLVEGGHARGTGVFSVGAFTWVMGHRERDLNTSSAPEDLRQFLFDHVTTYDELALLLLAQRESGVYWSATTAAENLGLSTEACHMALERLAAHGLLLGHGSRTGFRYAPNNESLATNADRLRRAYVDDRFAIVQIMTANAMDRVRGAAARSFGEALQQRGQKGSH